MAFGFGKIRNVLDRADNNRVFSEEKNELIHVETARKNLESLLGYFEKFDRPLNSSIIKELFVMTLMNFRAAEGCASNVSKAAINARKHLLNTAFSFNSVKFEEQVIGSSAEFLNGLKFLANRLTRIETAYNNRRLTPQMLKNAVESEIKLIGRFETALVNLYKKEKRFF